MLRDKESRFTGYAHTTLTTVAFNSFQQIIYSESQLMTSVLLHVADLMSEASRQVVNLYCLQSEEMTSIVLFNEIYCL